jgi:hypothetical protein
MFVRYRIGLCAEADAPAGGGNSSNAAAGAGNADVNELINIAVSKRVKKAVEKAMESLRGDLASVVKEAMGQQQTQHSGGDQAASGNDAQTQDRLTLKALQDQIEREKKSRLDLEHRLKEADQRAKSERMRSTVERHAASKLGADNPMLSLFMESFYDTRKRVAEQGEGYFVKFKDSLGEDELRPLEDAFTSMFDKGGEYHHLIQSQAKVNGLPPRSPLAKGNPMPGQRSQNGTQQIDPAIATHPIYGTVAQALRSAGDHDKAAGLEHVVSLPANGTAEK